jgi:NADPH:quinone reductase-like Zn-dependent oxidoreductase
MKAIIFTKYGPPEVLELREIEKPIPKENEVLVKVYATSVNFGDLFVRNFNKITPGKFPMPFILWVFSKIFFGFKIPKINIPGSEFAGVIESTGREVKELKKGDQVFGYLGQKMGAYAEYICISEKGTITLKPSNMNYFEASAIPYGLIMALGLLRKLNIHEGQKILINGASGGIGSAAVQLAKYFGAEVTGVCSTPRMEYVRSLGADFVIDYTKEDFSANGQTYDIIFDIPGKSSFSICKDSLTKNGIYLLASFKSKQLLQMLLSSLTGNKKVICSLAAGTREDLISVKEFIETGKIKSIIDKCFPLEKAAEAHSYVEKGNKKGNIVITVKHDN